MTPITRIIRDLAPDQPVERAATLEDVRAEVLGILPIVGAATILVTAAVLASLVPAARAARVDVMTALRTD